ncbi:MAG: 30S ribosomal protein S15 [Hyphomicrobiales bacterium]
MYLTSDKKKEIFAEHGKDGMDTGTPEGQVALFTFRIKHLSEHMKKNRKDLATERALVRLVGKRRKLLDYLKKIEIDRYRTIIKKLGIRK